MPPSESNELLDEMEDKRLVRLGIDPEMSELDILSELLKRSKAIDERKSKVATNDLL